MSFTNINQLKQTSIMLSLFNEKGSNIIRIYGVTTLEGETTEIIRSRDIIHGDLCNFSLASRQYPNTSTLAALFWQLTSCRPPFEILVWRFALLTVKAFQSRCDRIFLVLYQRCWEFEPDDRPDISE
ncbi:unnamed protein product [Rhizophagus irregularis]|uniref:Uncharacterized protein n=1 Tax=Rhizophagus irregularis TaxID=588596 RepID=A0A916DZL9_9GLOM|nr:unnamed protein product [Rhizophagus irregularis]